MTRRAFEQLFLIHREPVFRFLLRLCHARADAEDLLQETWLTLWRKRHQFEGRGHPLGYLRQIAYRLFLNHMRRTTRRRALAHHIPVRQEATMDLGSDDADEQAVLLTRVRAALEGLPAANRDAFVMFRFEGMTCAEIAGVVGAPVKTVESRLRRATLALMDLLASERTPGGTR